MAASHQWHAGELFIQSQLGHSEAVAGAHAVFQPRLTAQHQQFHTALNILSVCTLDGRGRPWGSFLSASDGSHGFIKSPSFNSLIAAGMKLHEGHPVETALKEGAKFGMTRLVRGDDTEYQGPGLRLIAGVGIMFENRRRNKFSGFINERNVGSQDQRTIQVEVMESLGNCPKYINTRNLVPNPNHDPVTLHKSLDLAPGESLPKETLEHIAQADTIFLATRYTSPVQTIFQSRLGINIRGGKPGFLRITTEATTDGIGGTVRRQVAYLPDYSGNRFMSSLGNIHSDKVAGITVPLMKQGLPIDVVYLTGEARVLLGKESNIIFPGVNTCVRIELTGYIYVRDAVPLMPVLFNPAEYVEDFQSGAEDGIGWSPYNPPVRRLRSELSTQSAADAVQEARSHEAKIIAFEQHTVDLASITFRLSPPVKYIAGQHVILDCGSLLDSDVKEYKHMSVKYGGEQELNDGGIRTWTISSAPNHTGKAEDTIVITMRRVGKGLITPKLFEVAKTTLTEQPASVVLPVLGVGGEFVLSKAAGDGVKMLWIASGVGITPFLSFLRFLASSRHRKLDVTLVLAVRRAEALVMLDLVRRAITSRHAETIGKLCVHVFSAGLHDNALSISQLDGTAFDLTITFHDARLSPDLLLSLSGRERAEVWVCGPPQLETSVVHTLESAGWPTNKLHRESFAF
ncbi:uncharacterized protein UMAG_00583 [Mycosarcoma maydis]|uniref:FAD-binding FR-type domain-containing protein n=1 Tax=Mycosarcoma maydis TaxID=5270 RepID=A0A0D1ED68_MYCMD|nr:uncharacterized protein UMAG_00583 [Ustilago maydis 521]KIS72165.1 hypothetical protein UMAG_00583 [Ustilago maydis 521]|eukprot:XP_011386409.1 hypothetical protein UMAG_00583 [Ustilago maydis 521]